MSVDIKWCTCKKKYSYLTIHIRNSYFQYQLVQDQLTIRNDKRNISKLSKENDVLLCKVQLGHCQVTPENHKGKDDEKT